MADRYWVGGSGTWNTTSTTNWSTSSGGSSGASVPTAADSVFFDQASTYTVTLTGALTCLDITVSAGTVTFAQGTSPTLAISGSMSLVAGTVWNASGNITFNATTTGKTITTNGVTLQASNTIFNGVGGGWTLGSALTFRSNGNLTVTNGTFDTGNYNLTGGTLSSSNSNTRTITLGSSTVTLSTNGVVLDFSTATNLTFNANTSQITASNSTATLNGGGQTFYNVSFTNGLAAIKTINGANTFNNLTFNGNVGAGDSTGATQINFGANQTINGTLSTTNVSVVARVFLFSDTVGTARTLTCAATSLADTDFRDITIAGAAAPISPTRAGNCGGNSGITFPAAKTVYWNLAGTQQIQSTGWATSSNGSPDVNNFPLAQDTIIFDDAGAAGTITMGGYNFGTVDMSNRTSAMTLSIGFAFSNNYANVKIYNNWTTGTGVTLTLTGSGQIDLASRTSQTITSNGVTFANRFNVIGTGTVVLNDNLTTSRSQAGAWTLTDGTLNLNGKTLTLSAASIATFLIAAGTKNLTFNGGTLSIASSGVSGFNNANPTNFTTTAGTGTGTIKLTSASAKTFAGGGSTYNCTLDQGGAGALTITGSNTFNDITNTYSSTGATTITFTAGTTNTFNNWNASGTIGKVLTIGSATAASHTLSKSSGTVSADYLSISRSTATGGATWYAGANSTNGGNNTGWLFTSAPVAATSSFLLFFR